MQTNARTSVGVLVDDVPAARDHRGM